jgi:DAHP synthetase I family
MRISRHHFSAIHRGSRFVGSHRSQNHRKSSSQRAGFCIEYANRYALILHPHGFHTQSLVGFKNSTDGTISIAIDACRAAISGHVFLSVGKEGLSSIVETEGNPDVHVILRGGKTGVNYERESVEKVVRELKKGKVNHRLMVSS